MDELVAYSERRVRAGIAALPDGRYEASELLETADGELELRVAVTVAGDELELDFAGTAPQHDGNLNCPLAVTDVGLPVRRPRCLTDPDVPASAGALVAGHRARAGGLPRQRTSARRGRRRATSRRRAGSSTCSSAPSRRPCRCRRRARGR